MFIVIGLMICGIGLGYLLRNRRIAGISHAITVLIWGLLFLLGLEVGHNKQIVGNIQNIGLQSAIISMACTLGSVLAAWALWHFISPKD